MPYNDTTYRDAPRTRPPHKMPKFARNQLLWCECGAVGAVPRVFSTDSLVPCIFERYEPEYHPQVDRRTPELALVVFLTGECATVAVSGLYQRHCTDEEVWATHLSPYNGHLFARGARAFEYYVRHIGQTVVFPGVLLYKDLSFDCRALRGRRLYCASLECVTHIIRRCEPLFGCAQQRPHSAAECFTIETPGAGWLCFDPDAARLANKFLADTSTERTLLLPLADVLRACGLAELARQCVLQGLSGGREGSTVRPQEESDAAVPKSIEYTPGSARALRERRTQPPARPAIHVSKPRSFSARTQQMLLSRSYQSSRGPAAQKNTDPPQVDNGGGTPRAVRKKEPYQFFYRYDPDRPSILAAPYIPIAISDLAVDTSVDNECSVRSTKQEHNVGSFCGHKRVGSVENKRVMAGALHSAMWDAVGSWDCLATANTYEDTAVQAEVYYTFRTVYDASTCMERPGYARNITEEEIRRLTYKKSATSTAAPAEQPKLALYDDNVHTDCVMRRCQDTSPSSSTYPKKTVETNDVIIVQQESPGAVLDNSTSSKNTGLCEEREEEEPDVEIVKPAMEDVYHDILCQDEAAYNQICPEPGEEGLSCEYERHSDIVYSAENSGYAQATNNDCAKSHKDVSAEYQCESEAPANTIQLHATVGTKLSAETSKYQSKSYDVQGLYNTSAESHGEPFAGASGGSLREAPGREAEVVATMSSASNVPSPLEPPPEPVAQHSTKLDDPGESSSASPAAAVTRVSAGTDCPYCGAPTGSTVDGVRRTLPSDRALGRSADAGGPPRGDACYIDLDAEGDAPSPAQDGLGEHAARSRADAPPARPTARVHTVQQAARPTGGAGICRQVPRLALQYQAFRPRGAPRGHAYLLRGLWGIDSRYRTPQPAPQLEGERSAGQQRRPAGAPTLDGGGAQRAADTVAPEGTVAAGAVDLRAGREVPERAGTGTALRAAEAALTGALGAVEAAVARLRTEAPEVHKAAPSRPPLAAPAARPEAPPGAPPERNGAAPAGNACLPASSGVSEIDEEPQLLSDAQSVAAGRPVEATSGGRIADLPYLYRCFLDHVGTEQLAQGANSFQELSRLVQSTTGGGG